MALTWDATEVADYDSLTEDELVTRESLIFLTIGIGMPALTAENAREFYARASFYEKVNGAMRYDFDADTNTRTERYFSADEIRRFIGLRTNASRLSIVQFRTNVWKAHERWNVKF